MAGNVSAVMTLHRKEFEIVPPSSMMNSKRKAGEILNI